MTNQAVLVQDQKNKDFSYLYFKEVPVVYASVQDPKKKYQSEDMEWALTAFVNDATRAYLEDEVVVNKTLSKVGVDKNKKRKVKYALSSQRDDDNTVYDSFEGLNGISLSLNTKKKNGNPNKMIVVDAEGNEFKELVGNGSICNIKCFGYRNQDDALVIALNLVQVLEHVPFEGGGGSVIEDDVLGIKVDVSKPEPSKAAEPEPKDEEQDSEAPF